MKRQINNKKSLFGFLPVGLLVFLVCLAGTGSMLHGADQQSSAPAIMVVPDVVALDVKEVSVKGSGFTADRRVMVGVVGAYKGDDVWTDVVIPGKLKSFNALLNVDALRRARVKPGVYTVMAKGDEGEVATAKLTLKPAKKKKKK